MWFKVASLCLWVLEVAPSTSHLCCLTLSPPFTRRRISWLFLLYKKACCQSSWCSFLLLQQLLEVVWGGGVSGTYSGTFCSLCNHTRNDRYITQMVKYSFFEEDAILTRTALLSSSRHIFPIFKISFVEIWTPIQQKHTTTSASGAKPQPLS